MASNFERLLEWHYRKFGKIRSSRSKGVLSVGIIGAGMMGVEIAAANIRNGIIVALADNDAKARGTAPQRIAAELEKYPSVSSEAEQQHAAVFPSKIISGVNAAEMAGLCTDPMRVAHCSLVLETVVENADVKRQIYAHLEPHLGKNSILATNTSTIPIAALAAELTEPGRFCGIHFCHPVWINPLIEIIPGPRTDPQTVSAAVEYAKMLGKMPIVVEDGPGFLVNRLLLRYTDEAMHLLLDGAGIEQVDRAATEFGMALGPLRILDEIGLDTSLAAGRVLLDAFPERVARLPLLPLLVKRKQLGQKSGAGFYRYSPASTSSSSDTVFEASLGPNPETLAIIEHYAKRETPPSDEAILHRLLLAMVLEATFILQEKKRLDPREIDLSMICGLGFPANKGGLLHWADEIGAARILEMIESFEALGKRFQPTPMLREIARNGKRFYV